MLKNTYKVLILLIALLALGTNNAVAAGCKGKSKSSCSSDSSCTWVSGYTKQDGSKVKGYCRTKGQSGSKHDKKSSGKKNTDKKPKDKKVSDSKSDHKNTSDMKSKDKKSKDKKSKDTKSEKNKSKEKKSTGKNSKTKKPED